MKVQMRNTKNLTCSLCFAWKKKVSALNDIKLRRTFRMLLLLSPIEVTERYLANINSCALCTTALENISRFKDMLMENTKKEQKTKLCDVCFTKQPSLKPLLDHDSVLNMLLHETSLKKRQRQTMKCCNVCDARLQDMETFKNTVVNNQIQFFEKMELNEQNEDMTAINKDGIQCKLCDKVLKHKKSYNIHLKEIHGPTENYKHCDDCNITFKNERRYQAHFKTSPMHATKAHLCDQCDEVFRTSFFLRKHMEYTHQGVVDVCPICKQSFGYTYGLERHIIRKHKVNPKLLMMKAPNNVRRYKKEEKYKCEYCLFVCKNQRIYIDHKRLKHGPIEDNSYCLVCNKQFRTNSQLRRHKRRSALHMRQVQCKDCNKRFKNPNLLEEHLQNYHEKKNQQNEDTTSSTADDINDESLDNQSITYTEHRSLGDYECIECKLTFLNMKSYKRHLQESPKHSKNLSKFKHDAHIMFNHERMVDLCPICDRTIENRASLAKHIRVVHRVDPSKFLARKPMYVNSPSLKRAENNQHVEKRDYSCSKCDLIFISKSLLDKHVKGMHSGENNKCQLCLKVFSASSELAKHVLIHVQDIKHFSCDVCNESFKSRSCLRLHERSKHSSLEANKMNDKSNFVCGYCDITCKDVVRLERHINIKHFH